MTKKLKDYLFEGGVKGKWFKHIDAEDKTKFVIYKVLEFYNVNNAQTYDFARIKIKYSNYPIDKKNLKLNYPVSKILDDDER